MDQIDMKMITIKWITGKDSNYKVSNTITITVKKMVCKAKSNFKSNGKCISNLNNGLNKVNNHN